MRKKTARQKPYWEMTLDELREATKEFDKPIPLSKTRPLTKTQREEFERARAGGIVSVYVERRGDPKTVTVTLDEDLLKRADAYAAKRGKTLSCIISKSLRSALNFAE